jgi:hypothetical protein
MRKYPTGIFVNYGRKKFLQHLGQDELIGGDCLRVLSGTEGKIWSLDLDRRRIVAGGRFGGNLIKRFHSFLPERLNKLECLPRQAFFRLV